MGGLFVLGMIGLWLVFSIWFSQVMVNAFLKDSTALKTVLRILLALFLIALPFIDQLIAYPKWQQLCKTTGDFVWGPGMDEKKAFGRDYYENNETTEFTIFPNIKVSANSAKVLDANSDELLFTQPHYKYQAEAFLYLPSDSGNKDAILLSTCASYGLNGKNYEKTLQLKWINKKGTTK